MNTRHIQSFLIVSAAFFAMTGPVRAQGASALASVGAQLRHVAPQQDADAQPAAARAARKANAR